MRHSAKVAKMQAAKNAPEVDVEIENHGSIVLVRGVSDAGKVWIGENIGAPEEVQMWAGAIVAEPRYVGNIVNGMIEDGLIVAPRGR